MKIWLTPAELVKKQQEELDWSLEIADGKVQLFDEKKAVVAEWTSRLFLEVVSFGGDGEAISFQLPGATQHKAFVGSPKGIAKLRDFHDREYLRVHPNAASNALITGLGMIVFGLAVTGVAGYVSLENYNAAVAEAAKHPEGVKYTVWKGPIVVGIIIAIYGVMRLFQFVKWSQAAKRLERTIDPAPPDGLE